jgi:putative MATE family efflux protein
MQGSGVQRVTDTNREISLNSKFLFFLVPLIFSNALLLLSGTLTNVYVGQIMGVKTLAALYAIFPVLFLSMALITGLGVGASVLVGQAFGARNFDQVKAVAGSTLSLVLLMGVAVAIIGSLFTEPLLRVLSTPDDIFADATLYARLMFLFTPGLFVFWLGSSLTIGVGDTKTPLIAVVISVLGTLFFTATLFNGWFGVPQLSSTASPAVGAIGGSIMALAWQWWYMRANNHPLKPDARLLKHMAINPKIILSVLQLGLPIGVQMFVISIAEVAVLSFVNHYGSEATAAYGAATQVLNFVAQPALSIAVTASILGAQAVGSGTPDQLKTITSIGLKMNLWITGTLVLLIYLTSRTVLGWFITSPEIVDLAQTLVHTVLWSLFILGVSEIFAGVMRSTGTVGTPTVIAIFAIVGIEIPVAYLLSQRLGLSGIWYAYPAMFLGMMVLQAAFYYLRWYPRAMTLRPA